MCYPMVLHLDFAICITSHLEVQTWHICQALQALQIVIVPTPARLGLRSVHPRVPPSFAGKLCHRGSGRARFRTRLKALVWFWIIDETLVLTSILSVCRLNEVGTCQVMEQR